MINNIDDARIQLYGLIEFFEQRQKELSAPKGECFAEEAVEIYTTFLIAENSLIPRLRAVTKEALSKSYPSDGTVGLSLEHAKKLFLK